MASSSKKTTKRRKSSNTGRRRSASRKGQRVLWPDGAVSREVLGFALMVVGVFFTAAFVTGHGALLGDAGGLAITHLLGVAGYALAPLAVLAGVLMMVRKLRERWVVGVALLLLATAMALSAFVPAAGLFDRGVYPEYGGLVGSGLFYGVRLVGGLIGAFVVIFALYAVGVSLLTSITFDDLRRFAESVGAGVGGMREALSARFARRRRPVRRRKPSRSAHPGPVEVGEEERPPEVEPEPVPEEPTEEEAFRVVLPEPVESGGGGEEEPLMNGDYTPPPISMLRRGRQGSEHDAEETSRRLTAALEELGVRARVIRAVVGPRVTRYELRLGSGVKVSRVKNLQQDIAYALAATEVRILAPIPGKSAVGVEVPNTRPAHVTLGDVFQEYPAGNDWKLPVGIGKDISGRAQFIDLGDMPHLLIAGTTGSGKSVMLNGMLTSLLLTTDPREVKMVLIDPKRVELSQFAKVPHLITPVVTDVKRASNALTWAVSEMDRRYEVLEKMGVRSLEGYNARADTPMPYVVIVIDELADLMMTAAAKVEDAVIRLAQKARAVGIHLVVATQRPSVDVITGMIKANIPSRIAFAVSSQVDSRVIMDGPGAEALLGMGDMLFKPVSASRPFRVQGAYISEKEVEEIVEAAAERAKQRFVEDVTAPQKETQEQDEPEDELLRDAATFVVSTQQASVSAIQRRFRVGYSRAGRIVDALERKGVVGPYEGSKSRSVIAAEHDLPAIFGEEGDD
jgi:S-DNA-T family DNA segregation ATPase FtsK/SpoIIIE